MKERQEGFVTTGRQKGKKEEKMEGIVITTQILVIQSLFSLFSAYTFSVTVT